MAQSPTNVELKRNRFGKSGMSSLFWSVDGLPQKAMEIASSPSELASNSRHNHNLEQQQQQQQQCSLDNQLSSTDSPTGAECYVHASLTPFAASRSEGKSAESLAVGTQLSPNTSPRKASIRPSHKSFAKLHSSSSSSISWLSPLKAPAFATNVQQLAAAFERRCAASSPSSPHPTNTSTRPNHLQTHHNTWHQVLHHSSTSSLCSSASDHHSGNPDLKPATPFATLTGQQQALLGFAGAAATTAQQLHQEDTTGLEAHAISIDLDSSSSSSITAIAAITSRHTGRLPPRVSCVQSLSSSRSDPIDTTPSLTQTQHSSRDSLKLQRTTTPGPLEAAAAATNLGSCLLPLDSLHSAASSSPSLAGSRRGSSLLKPKPPAGESSPQRSRPSMVRTSCSALMQGLEVSQGLSAAVRSPQWALGDQGQACTQGDGASSMLPADEAVGLGDVGSKQGAQHAVQLCVPATYHRVNQAPQPVATAAADQSAGAGLEPKPTFLHFNQDGQAATGPDVASSFRQSAVNTSPLVTGHGSMHNAKLTLLSTQETMDPSLGSSGEGSGTTQDSTRTLQDPARCGRRSAAPAAADCSDRALAGVMEFQMQQQQQIHAMQQQLKLQQSTRAPVKVPTSHQQQQQCVPIAIARHCPQDLKGPSWQPKDFIQTKKLYEGKIAAVVQGYHASSGRPLALKVYNRARLDTMERFQLAREVCLHMRSCHPSITALYAAYKDARYIYLLMELAPSGNLYQMLMSMPLPPGRARCLPERDAVIRVIRPLLAALAYLHEQGIIHRDIKLENVLLTIDGDIKLADFGLSIDTRHEPANTRLGTQGYFAPEVLALPLKSSPFEGKSPEEAASRPSYDCKVDVWSAGVVCFEVLTGRAPFAAEKAAQVLQAILHRQLVYPSHLSKEAASFLSTALIRDPKARPGVRELLQHPFIALHAAPSQQKS